MLSLRRQTGGPVVLSLSVRATMAPNARVQGRFEVLARHLFDRMLHNDAFGEDAALRAMQLAYAVALPGVLVALFLFAAYHQPPERARTAWAQTADHLFYVTYAMVVMGLALISQWEMLFPDLLDAQVLLSLPIRRSMLLTARVAALGIFLLLAHAGTSGLGAVFFPAVADLSTGFARHVAAHALAVTVSASATVLALVALQALLVCLPGRRLSEGASTMARLLAVVMLLTTLFLFPLTAHALPAVLQSRPVAVRAFPPFWYLGLYEVALYGRGAAPVFHDLARAGALAGVLAAGAAATLYPAAHAIRLKRLVEGPTLRRGGAWPLRRAWPRALHLLLRTAGERATFHFTAQTLWRLPRLQLSLAMYAGVGLALLLSVLLAFTVREGRVSLVIVESGVGLATPVLAFWTAAGLRTALASPVGRQGRWLFDVAGATSRREELRGGRMLATMVTVMVTVGGVALLRPLEPGVGHTATASLAQLVLAAGLATLLCDLLFLAVRTLPFTTIRPAMTRELPVTLVLYFVAFPAFALYVAGAEMWVEASVVHAGLAALAFVAAHAVLGRVRATLFAGAPPADDLFLEGIGLRD